MTALILRTTTPDDLDWVVASEQLPAVAPFVEMWPRTRHAAALSDPVVSHLTLVADGLRVGFALLAGLAGPRHVVELRRLVVTDPGRGIGRSALREIKRLAFGALGAHRLWLDVKPSNARARVPYLSEGFTEDGTLRDALAEPDGPEALVVMAIRATNSGSLFRPS